MLKNSQGDLLASGMAGPRASCSVLRTHLSSVILLLASVSFTHRQAISMWDLPTQNFSFLSVNKSLIGSDCLAVGPVFIHDPVAVARRKQQPGVPACVT